MRRGLVVVLVVAAAVRAGAHVAPSVDDNNRYLKLTPQGDRVRLAYTVFFGDVPGAVIRREVDANHDAVIDDSEAQAFGNRVAGDVAAAIELSIDRTQQPIVWRQVAVGLGSSSVTAGAFSVDMITYACLARAGGRHEVLLRDRFRVPKPGETELLVDDGPGIRIDRARIGAATAMSHDFKFVGPGGPLGDDGLDLVFTADDRAQMSGECGSVPRDDSCCWWFGLVAMVAVVAVGAVGAVGAAVRRRHGPRR
jgi:hypothetical protein